MLALVVFLFQMGVEYMLQEWLQEGIQGAAGPGPLRPTLPGRWRNLHTPVGYADLPRTATIAVVERGSRNPRTTCSCRRPPEPGFYPWPLAETLCPPREAACAVAARPFTAAERLGLGTHRGRPRSDAAAARMRDCTVPDSTVPDSTVPDSSGTTRR